MKPHFFSFFLLTFLLLSAAEAAAQETPGTGGRDHGTIGGQAGGARVSEGSQPLENSLRDHGFIRSEGTAAGGESIKSEPLPEGGTKTTTTHADGSRTIEMTGRSVEPANHRMKFDKDGNVVEASSVHSDGKTDQVYYNPGTGVRVSEHKDPNTGITIQMTSKDGQGSTTIISRPGQPDTTVIEDANGNRTETQPKADGSETVTTTPNGGPSTETEYGTDGKPDQATTMDRSSDGRFVNGRTVTTFDDAGNPVKTEVKVVTGTYTPERVMEETTYGPDGKPKDTIRYDEDGMIVEMIEYGRDGKIKDHSSSEGHTPSDKAPQILTPGPNGGYLHRPHVDPAAKTPMPDSTSRFGDDLMRPLAGPLNDRRGPDTRNLAGFEGGQPQQDRWHNR